MRRSLIRLLFAAAFVMPCFSAAADPAPAQGARVLVIPVVTLNVPADKQWISKAVQETLVANFGQTTAWSPVAFSGQVVVEDNATAVRLAKEATAAYVIRGAAHAVNGDVRITAQLIDAKTGDTLATGIVTGKVEELLKLEDELAQQLRAGPAPATIATAPMPTGSGYVPRSNNPPPAAPGYPNNAPAQQSPNMNPSAYNAPAYSNDYQEYGVPAYYYSPVYTPYTSYYDPWYYSSYYYPPYPLYNYGLFGFSVNFDSLKNGFRGHHGGHWNGGGWRGNWPGAWRSSWYGGGFNHYPSMPFSANARAVNAGHVGFAAASRGAGVSASFAGGGGRGGHR